MNSTANEIMLDFITNKSGISFGDSLVYYMLGLCAAFIIFMALRMFTDFSNSVRVVISLLPMIIIDGLVSFGEYTFYLPFVGEKTISNFVMTFSLMDYIFGYQLFNPAKDIMSGYAVETVISSLPLQIITWAVSIGDSILQFVIFFFAFYYLISLVEFYFNKNIEWQLPISIILGALPVIIYAFFFSNPFEEFQKSNIEISNIINFFNNAEILDLVTVVIYAFFSFLIVLMIFAILIRFIMASAISFIPKLQSTLFLTSYGAVAFLLTLLYTFLYVLHPDYMWYNILITIAIWHVFRATLKDLSRSAKKKTSIRKNKDKTINDISQRMVELNQQFNQQRQQPQAQQAQPIEHIQVQTSQSQERPQVSQPERQQVEKTHIQIEQPPKKQVEKQVEKIKVEIQQVRKFVQRPPTARKAKSDNDALFGIVILVLLLSSLYLFFK